jgi:hypothetical protein
VANCGGFPFRCRAFSAAPSRVANPDPTRRFMIVPHRPRARAVVGLVLLGWLVSLWLVWDLTRRFAVPDLQRTEQELAQSRTELAELQQRIERLRQRNAVAKRSDDVSRAANQALQETLAQRDEEIAALRADTEFYERLVGGSAQRQGLAVHSLDLAPAGDGAWRYTLTLTQNLKKASVSKGEVTLRVDGVRDGKLGSLSWDELLQSPQAAPQGFSFRYFQQLEGSLMLPEGFTPHRVRVQLKSDGRQSEQVFPWKATQAGVS